jgi:hypothetical protein
MDTNETKNFLSGMYQNIHLFSNVMLKINEYGFFSARQWILPARCTQPVVVVTDGVGVYGCADWVCLW